MWTSGKRNKNKLNLEDIWSKFGGYFISVQNLPQQSGNAKAFAEAYLYFAGKKNAEAIEFLGLLKKILFQE